MSDFEREHSAEATRSNRDDAYDQDPMPSQAAPDSIPGMARKQRGGSSPLKGRSQRRGKPRGNPQRRSNTFCYGEKKSPMIGFSKNKETAKNEDPNTGKQNIKNNNVIEADDSRNLLSQAVMLAEQGGSIELPFKAELEIHFGMSLNFLRVHISAQACALISAQAFAVADLVVLSTLDTEREIIAEEVSHSIQQGGHKGAKPPVNDLSITDPNGGIEREAQTAGQAFAQGQKRSQLNNTKPIVARRLAYEKKTQWLDVSKNYHLSARAKTLGKIEKKAHKLSGSNTIDIISEAPRIGAASYASKDGIIRIKPLPRGIDLAKAHKGEGKEAQDRIIALSHELQHVSDRFQTSKGELRKALRSPTAARWEQLIRAEWRAHARQAKATFDALQAGLKVSDRNKGLYENWKLNTFTKKRHSQPQSMYNITASYIAQYSGKRFDIKAVEPFVKAHKDWVEEAFKIFPARS